MRLGGVSSDDLHGNLMSTTRARFVWLSVNLLTAVLASAVSGLVVVACRRIVARAGVLAIVGSLGGHGGSRTLTVAGRADGEFDIVAVQPGRSSVVDSLLTSPYDERAATLSPDGRWLAYVSNETGAYEVFVTPFPTADRRWQVSSGSAGGPVWAHDGRTLFYAEGEGMNAVDVDPGPPFVAGQPRMLFPLPTGARQSPVWDVAAGQFALTSDDQRFLMIRNVDPWVTTAAPELVLVQNFFEELRARVQER